MKIQDNIYSSHSFRFIIPSKARNLSPHALEALKGRKDPEAVKAVAKEMESLFAFEMIKAMRETTLASSEKSFGKDVYMSMFDMEIARLFAEKGLGLQDMIIKGLNSHANLPPSSSSASKTESIVLETESIVPKIRPFLPVAGEVSSPFGMRKHPIYGDYRFHHGLDIAAAEGTPIYPAMGGRVIFSGEEAGYGNIVTVDHGNGYITKYAHNRVNLVKEGDYVDVDTVIAEVGNSGVSTGPHLHFEVRYEGKSIDPVKVLAMR